MSFARALAGMPHKKRKITSQYGVFYLINVTNFKKCETNMANNELYPAVGSVPGSQQSQMRFLFL